MPMAGKKRDSTPGGASCPRMSIPDRPTKVRYSKNEPQYDPVHFIRSHSKNNDAADVQTQASKL